MSNLALNKESMFDEKVTIGKRIVLALQHVLAICPGTIAVPLLIGSALNLDDKTIAFLVSANLFTSGITVLIQVIGFKGLIGSRLPMMLGSSFSPLGPMILIGKEYGLDAVFGSIIGSAILVFIISFFMNKVLKLFPKVVVGTFVTLIGISLAPNAIKDLAGGEFSSSFGDIKNLLIGLGVLATIILIERFGRGMFKALSLVIGIVGGTIFSSLLGMVDFKPVMQAEVFQIITPFKFGAPEFKLGSIIIMTIFCVINMIQCIGVFAVLDEVTGHNTDNNSKIKGLKAQAVGQLISGIFNSVPSAMYNETVGLMNLTKVKSRSVIITAGVILMILGTFPKVAAIITMIPKSVLGGATLALFGVITSAGLSILSSLKFYEDNNFTIIGTSFAVGVGVTFAPKIFHQIPETLNMLCTNGLFMVSITSIILNLVLNYKPKSKIKTHEKVA
ncbi:uracil-xanthine permease family protein [Clostridium cylindrosporum]|uniref:Xanthine permease PbuX n=1 Tax=Clostridium cylindrosporum DSM 605 TaxID=1121307 RepID=A0A0J8D8I6_CLOCY|nr:nucleobase:cation symporter-2 family protein [Clostridium cylindrosporum]KMT22370.1 xanthine permease PbuX [Clostridium cylindrosporum DSM 605]